MKIDGKVYCFFEQSGTFKNEFKKLGYEAEDFDIQNEFGETDNVIDLFNEIETEYDNLQSTDNRQQTTDNRQQQYLPESILVKTLLSLFSLVSTLRRYNNLILHLCGTEHLTRAFQTALSMH
jgi:hypothetical protein